MTNPAPPHAIALDGHFLSATNPIANVEQRDLEAIAIRILQMPVAQQGKAQVAQRWKTLVGRDMTSEALSRFDELVEEFAFNYVLKAVNSDANYPKVLGHLYGPPHEWFGMSVPGSRGSGGDGPDQNYSIIPIDGYARFELHARRLDATLADVPFTLTGNSSLTMTLGSLDWQDVRFNPDDRFVITLDPQPANGRSNHIQTKLESRYLFIRDCRADWRQVPNSYRVKRLDPPTAEPLTINQMAERAARLMVDDVAPMYWFMRTFAGLEANTVTVPFGTGAIGGLVSQMISLARLKLADDEAFVVTAGSGGAPFRDLVLHDFWFRSFRYWQHTSSMNNAQGIPNGDGSTTYVISPQDPGVHNWLDTVGFHELLVVHRWQGLRPKSGAEGSPWVRGELVKLKALDRSLPVGMKRVTPAERQQQLAERLRTFKLRYVDG
jgi:hypothetical protein